MVCGARLETHAIFDSDPRKSEVCSDECFEVFMSACGKKPTDEELAWDKRLRRDEERARNEIEGELTPDPE